MVTKTNLSMCFAESMRDRNKELTGYIFMTIKAKTETPATVSVEAVPLIPTLIHWHSKLVIYPQTSLFGGAKGRRIRSSCWAIISHYLDPLLADQFCIDFSYLLIEASVY